MHMMYMKGIEITEFIYGESLALQTEFDLIERNPF